MVFFIVFRHANERRVKGLELESLDYLEENNTEFENVPSENESDDGIILLITYLFFGVCLTYYILT